MPWEWRRIALVAGATVSLCLAALAVDAWLPMAPSIAVRVGMVLAYPAVLLAFRFFTRSDLAAIRTRLRRGDTRR